MTDRAIKNASPREKEYFLTDSDGLRLRVSPTGVKTFQMRYTFYGKRKIVTIGDYPFISLASARNKVIEYKTKLANGIDPQAALMQEKLEASKTDEGQIHLVIEEWLLIRTHKVSRKTLIRDRGLIEHHFLPHFARYDTKKRDCVISTH